MAKNNLQKVLMQKVPNRKIKGKMPKKIFSYLSPAYFILSWMTFALTETLYLTVEELELSSSFSIV